MTSQCRRWKTLTSELKEKEMKENELRENEMRQKELREKENEMKEQEIQQKAIREREIIKKELEKERAKDKEKYDCSYFYSNPLFDCHDHLVKEFEELFQKEESKASNEYQLEFSKTLDVATKGHCPFQVVEKMSDTSYNLQFHGKYQVNVTFIDVDFTLLHVDDELDLRMNFFEEGWNDMIQQGSNVFKYILQ